MSMKTTCVRGCQYLNIKDEKKKKKRKKRKERTKKSKIYLKKFLSVSFIIIFPFNQKLDFGSVKSQSAT